MDTAAWPSAAVQAGEDLAINRRAYVAVFVGCGGEVVHVVCGQVARTDAQRPLAVAFRERVRYTLGIVLLELHQLLLLGRSES